MMRAVNLDEIFVPLRGELFLLASAQQHGVGQLKLPAGSAA